MIRNRDRIYGAGVTRRLRAMGILDKSTGTSFTLAKWLCRAADRINPARVRRSYDCPRRSASAPDLAVLCPLLQRHQNASVVGQRCTGLSPSTVTGSIKSNAVLAGLHHHYVRAKFSVHTAPGNGGVEKILIGLGITQRNLDIELLGNFDRSKTEFIQRTILQEL